VFVHAVPFTVHLEHGFFNYQPNFFEALARYNSYETLGVWVGPDWQLASLIPWDPILLDYLTMNSKTTHRLVVVVREARGPRDDYEIILGCDIVLLVEARDDKAECGFGGHLGVEQK
jgi:hypothetical protein